MTSEERHELRYQRRKAKRQEKFITRFKNELRFEQIFSYQHLYKSYKKSCKNVNWKASTQRYKFRSNINLAVTYKQLHNNKYKSRGFHEFDILERGKPRHIQSIHIEERVVQKCFCDYGLVKVLSSKFIYDNGAAIKGKGVKFALDRLTHHLHQYYHKYGTNEGYILHFDFSKYFERISHKQLFEQLDKYILDPKCNKLLHHFIDVFGDISLGLGSQVSQICALLYPNKLDHIIKEQLHIKYYGRYMDDGYLIHPSKEYLIYCLEVIKSICKELDIKLNLNKTFITKLYNPIGFLKHRYYLLPSGKVIRKSSKNCITKYQRKFRKLYSFYYNKNISLKDIEQSLQSILGYLQMSNCYKQEKLLYQYCQNLFNHKLNILNAKQRYKI